MPNGTGTSNYDDEVAKHYHSSAADSAILSFCVRDSAPSAGKQRTRARMGWHSNVVYNLLLNAN